MSISPNTFSQSKSDVRVVQALRAIASLLVVLDHMAPSYWNTQFGAIGVDIFFVISGFVMVISSSRGGANRTSFREFIRRRVIRIVPLYWMFTLLAFVFGSLRGKHYGLVYLVCSLLFVPCQVGDPHGIYFPVLGVGWSLNYEMFFYLCFAACIALKRSPYLLLPLLLFLSLLGLDQSLAEIPLLSLFNFRLIEFGAGMIAANAFERSWVLWPSAGILICLGSALIVGMNRIDGVSTHMLIWAPCAVAFFFGALALERPFGAHVPRPMLLLGATSYSIYLVHQQFVLAPINLMAGKLFPAMSMTANIFLSLFEFSAAVAAGIAVHMFLEGPLLKFFSERRRRKLLVETADAPQL